MAPLLETTSRRADQASLHVNGTQHSPPRSPRRPTMGILKHRLAPTTDPLTDNNDVKHQHQNPSFNDSFNEVRESLTMPHYSTSYDDDSEVCDDDTDDGRSNASSRQRGSAYAIKHVDAIISKSQRHDKSTMKGHHVQQEQAPHTRRRQNNLNNDYDDRSVGAASTKSTRSIASFFRGRKSNKPTTTRPVKAASNADDVSVASTKSGWWKRSQTTPEGIPTRSTAMTACHDGVTEPASLERDTNARGGIKTAPSFRGKNGEKNSSRSVSKNNDQLVADFFDVQSFASEPDLVGTSRLRKPSLNEQPRKENIHGKKSRMLETSSVVSSRSQRSNVFSTFFQRMRAINDEVLDIDDDVTPDLSGTGININDGNSIADDELTLCSGFDGFSQMDSVQDEYDNDDNCSLGSIDSNRSTLSNGSYGEGNVRGKNPLSAANGKVETVQETPFIHKIMQRRILKNEATILRDVVGLSNTTNHSPESGSKDKIQQPVVLSNVDNHNLSMNGIFTVTSQPQRHFSPKNRSRRMSTSMKLESPTQRSKALAQAGMKLVSSKSMGHLPSSIEPIADDATTRSERGLCRWNSDKKLVSDPSAPKRPARRPTRGGDSEEFKVPLPSPSARVSPNKSVDKLFKTSQSMRNLSSPYEFRSGSDVEDDDDDSILSLLSGLLATWSAERDGINLTITQRLPSSFTSGAKLKSILKSSSSSDSEEQKVDSRERYSVRFKTIEVREYERVVGDNPSCSKGPPISIGWGYKIHQHYSINDYEHLVRGPRRSKKEFHLAADRRTHLLINEWNCCEEDIRKARREATYIQYCRAKTAFSGSRAAAKEAAFLRKANDRSKNVVTPQPNETIVRDRNETRSPPKSPSRRRALQISAPPPVNRSMTSTQINAVSESARQKLLQV